MPTLVHPQKVEYTAHPHHDPTIDQHHKDLVVQTKGNEPPNNYADTNGRPPPTFVTDDSSPSYPSVKMARIDTSVRLQDTEAEGRPSIYLFIFVNPLSGDQKGSDFINLPIQHFRLRRLPQVQVEIHNILDEQDREAGLDRIKLIEHNVKHGQLPPINTHNNEMGRLAPAVRGRHIQVWSAGGDGTVMSVFEMLVERGIDLEHVFFSCIPFGTGNDFSQVLGWGRTVPRKDILGPRLQHLEELLSQRLENSDAARLDIWQIEMTAHPTGYVRRAGPERSDGHDVAEIDTPPVGSRPSMTRNMCNYLSIGVQGYVGSGFEKHRAGNRLANMLVYAIESAKWLFWRQFPPISNFIHRIVNGDETVLLVHQNEKDVDDGIPEMTKTPIDMVIQNIPHIWGREVDLWGEASSGLDVVRNRKGPADSNNWTPQRANDGRLEVMVISNLFSYFKKLANIRSHVSRVGQFFTPFEIQFRDPDQFRKDMDANRPSIFQRRNKYEMSNIICIMCDGEFYVMKDPEKLKFKRFAQIWTLGRRDEHIMGRLVKDELDSRQDGCNALEQAETPEHGGDRTPVP